MVILSKVLEYDSKELAKVIFCQKTNDQRLCSRLVKLYDIVAGFQNGSEDISIFVKRMVQAIILVQKNTIKHSQFYTSVLSSAFMNYTQHYQDILNEDFFEVVKKHQIPIPVADMTPLGCDAFVKVRLRKKIYFYIFV